MPRIAGIDLPIHKRMFIALTYIHGVGRANAKLILQKANVDAQKRVEELTPEEISRLQKVIETGYVVEGNLRRSVRDAIERLKRIGSYRGIRHLRGLPVRGQRTRTNARTGRGKRRTVGALTKDMAAKLETQAKKA